MGGGTRRPGNAQAAGDGQTGRQRGVKPAGVRCELRRGGGGVETVVVGGRGGGTRRLGNKQPCRERESVE